MKKPAIKKPAVKRPTLRAPQALGDLYRDLVDRRLLIPALALIVAIVAVPIVLKSSSEAAPPPPPPAAGDDAVATEAAVLAEQTGIRDYRKRLADLRSQDPFEPAVKPKTGGGAGGEDPAAIATPPDDSAAAPIAAPTGTGGGGSSVTTDVTVDEPSGDTGDPVDVDVEVDDPVPPVVEETQPDTTVYAERVDVKTGAIGHGRTLEGVQPLDVLPDKQTPVAAFIGLADGGEKAVFKLSPKVTETSGKGSCDPHKPKPCKLLTLEPGQDRYLKYEPNGKTYRLKLIETYVGPVAQ